MFFTNKDSHNEFHHPNQKQGVKAYKIQAKNAVALSLFTTLLISGAASAGTLYDIENNNTKANQTGVFHEANARLNASGSVSNNDVIDLYSIKDDGLSKTINWGFDSSSDALAMYVYKDDNKNKRHDPSDTYLFSLTKKERSKKFYSFKGAMYVVMVHNRSASGQNYYNMRALAPKTVKLNVISAKSYGKFDGRISFRRHNNKPDFYVKTRINNSRSRQSKTVGNNNTPVFNHNHAATLYPFGGIIPLSIDLYDSDRSSRDDQANIHPSPRFNRLDLVYDLARNQIRTDDGRVLGKPGQAITVKGGGVRKLASVTFVVR